MENREIELIEKLIAYQDPQTNTPFLKKYTASYLTQILDRNKIESIQKIYQSKEDGFNLLQFIRFFLNVLEHDQIETLYLTIALIDLFREISQSFGNKDRIFFVDITNYICNKILEKRNQENQIQSKFINDFRTIKPNFKVKQYLIDPPKIYGSKDEVVYKLSSNKIKVDKAKHQSVVTNSYFSYTLKKVFTLDSLSDSISVYNTNCSLIKKIRPSFSKLKKDIVVLSFAYSERQQRIGAVLKDFSINFWDHCDNFQFQKSMSTASYCQQYQTNIWFLQYFDTWATSDKTGVLYLWDLEAEKPSRTIKLAYESKINDLCVISCINLLAIVQERNVSDFDIKNNNNYSKSVVKGSSENSRQNSGLKKVRYKKYRNYQRAKSPNQSGKQAENIWMEKKDENLEQKQGNKDDSSCSNQNSNGSIVLYNFFKGEAVARIQLPAENRIPHTIQYSQNYQVLLSAGYQKKISIFQINKIYLDSTQVGQLTGHQSLITSFTVLKKSPMVVSADDKGKVKIWDIRNYKCVQTLDFKDKTNITKLLDMLQLGKIGVLGSRINFVEFDEKNQIQKRLQSMSPTCAYDPHKISVLNSNSNKVIPLAVQCDYENEELIVLTKKDLRIYSLRRGILKSIYCQFHSQQTEITFFKYFESLKKIVMGTEKGQIKLYCMRTGVQQARLIGHSGSINHIQFDQSNNIFVSMGQDGSIHIQKQLNQKDLGKSQQKQKCNMISGKKQKSNKALKDMDKATAFKMLFNACKDEKNSQNINKTKQNRKNYIKSQNQINDQTNSIFRSGMQKYSSQGLMLRAIKNNIHNNEISLAVVSIYHGLIAVASTSQNCKNVYIWDYQYCKLMIQIKFPSDGQITAMAFINGYGLLAVGTSQGIMYLLRITNRKKNNNNSNLKQSNTSSKSSNSFFNYHTVLVAQYNRYPTQKQSQHSFQSTSKISNPISHICVDLLIKGFNQQDQKLHSCKLHLGFNDGTVCIIDLFPLLTCGAHQSSNVYKQSFNAERQLRENFATELAKKKYNVLDISHKQGGKNQQFQQRKEGKQKDCLKIYKLESPMSVYWQNYQKYKVKGSPNKQQSNSHQNTPENQKIFMLTTTSKANEQNNLQKRPDYINGSQQLVTHIDAHRSPITSLYILQLDSRYLVTTACDGRLKIWAQKDHNQWKLECDTSINLPLPFQWNIKAQYQQKYKNKIMFAMKIIQQIFTRYGNDISINEAKVLKVRKLLDLIQQQPTQQQHQTSIESLDYNAEIDNQNKVTLFQQQFSKRDLNYDYIKKFNFSQIGGPTLRQIQVQKKLGFIQKQWKINTQKTQEDKNKLLISIRSRAQKNQEKQQIMAYLQPKNFNKPNTSQQHQQSSYVNNLMAKLQKPYQQQNINTIENLSNTLNVINAPTAMLRKSKRQLSMASNSKVDQGGILKKKSQKKQQSTKNLIGNSTSFINPAKKAVFFNFLQNIKNKGLFSEDLQLQKCEKTSKSKENIFEDYGNKYRYNSSANISKHYVFSPKTKNISQKTFEKYYQDKHKDIQGCKNRNSHQGQNSSNTLCNFITQRTQASNQITKNESKNFRSILNKMNERVQQSKKKKVREITDEVDKQNLRKYLISTSESRRCR